jgi:branched-chain amino acid transport system permease protein
VSRKGLPIPQIVPLKKPLSKRQWIIPAVIVIVLVCLIPILVKNPYQLDLVIWIFLSNIFATCVYQVAVVNRILFGVSAFIGIGAYISTVLVVHGMSFWLALPLAGLASAGVAYVIGYPLLRVGGIYFAIITWCFAEVLVTFYKIVPGFGGIQGFHYIPSPSIFGNEFSGPVPYFYLVLGLMAVTLGFFYRLRKSRFGQDLKVIGSSDTLARALGINVPRYRLLCFAIAGFFIGIGGSFYAHYMSYIEPYRFGITLSSQMFAFAVIGGLGNLWGGLIGSTAMILIPEGLHAFEYMRQVIYGAVIIFVMVLMPGGIISLPRQIRLWRQGKIKE